MSGWVLALAMWAPDLGEPPTWEERQQVEASRAACRHDGPHVDPWIVLGLHRMEADLGVTEWRPGLLGAVWCVEAGMRTESRRGGSIRGDWRDGVAMAKGPLQLWPVTLHACGLDTAWADDLWASARCWVERVEATRPKAERLCGEADAWGVAEAAVSNVRRYQWRCDARSKHWHASEWAVGASPASTAPDDHGAPSGPSEGHAGHAGSVRAGQGAAERGDGTPDPFGHDGRGRVVYPSPRLHGRGTRDRRLR